MMTHPQATSPTAIVKLVPFEGRQLHGFLEALTAQSSIGLDGKILGTLLEKLDDANALARWLREYVVLELDPNEVHQVRKALEAAIGPEADRSPKAHPALSAIRDKLARLAVDSVRAENTN